MSNTKDIVWQDRKRTLFGLPLSFTKYSLSQERLFINTGFLNTEENEVRLYRILDVKVKRSLGQRIFGVGTIEVHSSDKSMKDFEIKSVKHPHNVKEMLSTFVEQQRDAKRVVGREYMSDGDEFDGMDD